MTRQKQPEKKGLDTELADLPPELRWREWMMRVEAVIFAASEPVTREILARVVGKDCSIDLVINDLREELRGRPYEIICAAGGWQHRSRPAYAPAIRASQAAAPGPAMTLSERHVDFTQTELMVLVAIAYHQPVTRAGVSDIIGHEASRDIIGALRDKNMITAGPRSPTPGAPFTYVTTKAFLSHFALDTLRDLPDLEALEDAGLLSGAEQGAHAMPMAEGLDVDHEGDDEDADTSSVINTDRL